MILIIAVVEPTNVISRIIMHLSVTRLRSSRDVICKFSIIMYTVTRGSLMFILCTVLHSTFASFLFCSMNRILRCCFLRWSIIMFFFAISSHDVIYIFSIIVEHQFSFLFGLMNRILFGVWHEFEGCVFVFFDYQ